MLRKVLVSAVALSVAAGAVGFAQAQQAGNNDAPAAAQQQNERRPSGFFSRLDANNDGSIAKDEFGGNRLDQLQAADENTDGTLSQEELASYLMKREFERGAARMANRLDINGDGNVTIAELESQQAKRFALLDRNDDGQLSQDELRRGALGKRAMNMRDGEGRRFAMRDGDRHHPRFMHRMDRDRRSGNEQPAQE